MRDDILLTWEPCRAPIFRQGCARIGNTNAGGRKGPRVAAVPNNRE